MTGKYYNVDLGVFPTNIRLCFDQAGLDKILYDHCIDLKIKAFELGVAETHYLTAGKHGIVIIILNIAEIGNDAPFAHGLIAHEAYHAARRVFENIGEKSNDVGEETMAYTIERIARMVSTAMGTELERRNVGKAGRGVPKQAGKRTRGSVV